MLSIVIPTLNEENYLPLLLESIKQQDFNEEYEIIVADNNSKDKTAKIAKEYGCKVISGGLPPKGRNEGARIAKGELILFSDADVTLPPHFLEKVLEEFKIRKLGIASFPLHPKKNRFDKIIFRVYNLYTRLVQNLWPIAAQAILVRKEIHQIIGGFDEKIKIGEDHDYVIRAAKFDKFGFLSQFVLSSSRRFERDGRIRTYLKYLLIGVYMVISGPVRSDIFKYRFGHYKKISK